jgi:hypothetical protein
MENTRQKQAQAIDLRTTVLKILENPAAISGVVMPLLDWALQQQAKRAPLVEAKEDPKTPIPEEKMWAVIETKGRTPTSDLHETLEGAQAFMLTKLTDFRDKLTKQMTKQPTVPPADEDRSSFNFELGCDVRGIDRIIEDLLEDMKYHRRYYGGYNGYHFWGHFGGPNSRDEREYHIQECEVTRGNRRTRWLITRDCYPHTEAYGAICESYAEARACVLKCLAEAPKIYEGELKRLTERTEPYLDERDKYQVGEIFGRREECLHIRRVTF